MLPGQREGAYEQSPVKLLEDLLNRARNGEVCGLAYAVMTKEKKFELGYSGAAIADPIRTLGIIKMMEMEFAETVRRQLRIVR